MDEYYGVFLRGVNVNGVKIPMQALREVFRGMGFAQAQTVLNTGNVVLKARPEQWPRPELKARIGQALQAAFGYSAPVFLRTADELAGLYRAAERIAAPEGCHFYMLLGGDADLPAELGALFVSMPHLPGEMYLPLQTDAFWVVPKGSTLASAFGSKALGAKKYQNRLTSRNRNTIQKMLAMMESAGWNKAEGNG